MSAQEKKGLGGAAGSSVLSRNGFGVKTAENNLQFHSFIFSKHPRMYTVYIYSLYIHYDSFIGTFAYMYVRSCAHFPWWEV